jgi:hypothetical protein
MEWKYKVISVKTVSASQVFEGLEKAFDIFCDGTPPFSWGDNSFSLITPPEAIEHLNSCSNEFNDKDETAEVETAIKRLKALRDGEYVDLEN